MKPLVDYKRNVWSQYGEDGIIEEILNRISTSGVELDHWCCEFGAWDGLHLSNTALLIREGGYKAVLIEGDSRKFFDLKQNFPTSEVEKVCSFVTPAGKTSLDNILKSTAIPSNFDFLSIDIDGMDYHILNSLKEYGPKLVCIEFNPTIPNIVEFVQENNDAVKQGSSARSILELASSLGYDCIAATYCNLFLIKKEFTEVVSSSIPSLDELVPLGTDPQYVFVGYDGSILSNKSSINLQWHESFPVSNLQILPKFLRKYSGDYNRFEKLFFRIFVFLIRSLRF